MRGKMYTWLSDAGHAWLRVPLKDISALGLGARDFSRYSYRRDGKRGIQFYLEEDCDAGVFLNAYVARHGRPPRFAETWAATTSPVRSYERLAG